MVLEIAESVCSWKPACMRTCHSGVMSCAVTKARCTRSGTSGKWMCPCSAIRFTSSSEYHPSARAMATKSSLTSGIITPAWLRMNATANSGSIPDEHPAMMEMVPVGATVVTLQLRRRRSGRMRSPLGARAHDSSGPQMERSHCGNTPRLSARFSDSRLDSSSMNSITRRPISTPSSEL